MNKIVHYKLPLTEGGINNLNEISALIEDNSILFESAVLSTYGGDSRYSFLDDSFKVSSIVNGFVEFTCQVNFYAGCADQNDTFDESGSFEFEIEEGHLVFELDETVWRTE